MNTIVVGVDRSPQALVAARKAADMAKALGAELHIVNRGHEERGPSARNRVGPNGPLRPRLGRTRPPGHCRRVSQQPRRVDESVRSNPAEALCSEADRLHASMIVVGNKRVQGVVRVLGSVAGAVAKDAPCDVYIVHTYD